jgi:hypothetical protein
VAQTWKWERELSEGADVKFPADNYAYIHFICILKEYRGRGGEVPQIWDLGDIWRSISITLGSFSSSAHRLGDWVGTKGGRDGSGDNISDTVGNHVLVVQSVASHFAYWAISAHLFCDRDSGGGVGRSSTEAGPTFNAQVCFMAALFREFTE